MDLLIQESEWGKRNSMLEDKDFELTNANNLPELEEEHEITKADFELVKVDNTVHEQKFQTRPTTFLKDSLRRFSKNKSSVVAAYILGGLLLMSFLVPIIDRTNTKVPHPNETYLAPKLFNSGTGWWDGTEKYSKIAVDTSKVPEGISVEDLTPEEKQEYLWPSASKFPQRSAISKKKFTDLVYTNDATSLGDEGYGKEGYLQFGYAQNVAHGTAVDFSTQRFNSLSLVDNLFISTFDVCDLDKIKTIEGKDDFANPDNYELGECAFYFNYVEENTETHELEHKDVKIVDYALTQNIGSVIAEKATEKVNLAQIVKDATSKTEFENAYFSVRMIADGTNKCSLIRSIVLETESSDETLKKNLSDLSFTDATKCMTATQDKGFAYWSSTGIKRIFLSKAYFCSFVYDTYEAAFGTRTVSNFSIIKLLEYEKNGWVSFKDEFGFATVTIDGNVIALPFGQSGVRCTIINEKKCPLARPLTGDDFYAKGNSWGCEADICYYKFLGYSTMPRYLMGTDKSGRDMFKYVFEGLRTSLLLGVLTFIVCFLFGLAWGAVCGYFGGTVDLVMERFTDILSGVPWIVVMTLIIIHMGSNFWTFALALCMTGWIGTAATTRTQFYRFRGREYVLASRTLGASDARLIAKHILPNALGTIITGSVLMIPSVIFSEATISYLGLGLKNISSLGVILSDNQSELLTSSYLLIFPAIIIALVMISFNLFGNGLRDAINPSLKGEE